MVPMDAPGVKVEEYLWTFNMPTDHAHVSFTDVRVPDTAIFGGEGRGLQIVQHFSMKTVSARRLPASVRRNTASTKRLPTPGEKTFRQGLASNQEFSFHW